MVMAASRRIHPANGLGDVSDASLMYLGYYAEAHLAQIVDISALGSEAP